MCKHTFVIPQWIYYKEVASEMGKNGPSFDQHIYTHTNTYIHIYVLCFHSGSTTTTSRTKWAKATTSSDQHAYAHTHIYTHVF